MQRLSMSNVLFISVRFGPDKSAQIENRVFNTKPSIIELAIFLENELYSSTYTGLKPKTRTLSFKTLQSIFQLSGWRFPTPCVTEDLKWGKG